MMQDNSENEYAQNIYLVRHGHLEKDRVRRYVGQTDYPLSAQGINQAENLRDLLADIPFQRIVCSDLQRTIKTRRNHRSISKDKSGNKFRVPGNKVG